MILSKNSPIVKRYSFLYKVKCKLIIKYADDHFSDEELLNFNSYDFKNCEVSKILRKTNQLSISLQQLFV